MNFFKETDFLYGNRIFGKAYFRKKIYEIWRNKKLKKVTMILLTFILVFSLAACGNKDAAGGGEANIKDSLELLDTVWSSYSEDEKFPAAGGDMSEENASMEGPGRYGIEDAALLDSILGFPAANVEEIDDAASLMHMMNANTFTCGAYRVKNAGDISKLTTALKDNIMSRQWMCGFPEKLVIMTVDNYVISFFGNGEIADTFKEKLSAAYTGAETVVEEPIM